MNVTMSLRKISNFLLTRPLFALAIFLSLCATPCFGHTEATTDISPVSSEQTDLKIVGNLKEWIGNAIDKAPPSFMRKLLEADVSPRCSLGLLKLVRGIRNLQPWALRLLDSSGKYPTGALQISRADLGAFDECVETVMRDEYGHETVRGQYCNLLVYTGNASDLENIIISAMEFTHPRVRKFAKGLPKHAFPIVRLGLCLNNDCNQDELQALLKAVLPQSADVRISDCVTAVRPGITKGQIAILCFLGVLALCIMLATVVDISSSQHDPKTRGRGILLSVLMSFSIASNTRMLLHVTQEKGSDSYTLRFMHGIRFWSIIWIVMGHCYIPPPEVISRVLNYILHAGKWENMIIAAAFLGVDTFFFMSGYLVALAVNKQKRSGVVVFLCAVVRRLIRTMPTLFFMLMCWKLLPLIASGPGAKTLFDKVDDEFRRQWMYLLLNVQNYAFNMDTSNPVLMHLWYLSTDFQLFLVALPMLILLKTRPKVPVIVFALLSLLGCSVAAWQVAGSRKMPFLVVVNESVLGALETLYHYYFYPFYHAVCYFTGCITFFLVSWFKNRKIPKPLQTAAWCVAIACGLCCIFMKTLWYRTSDPTTEFGKLSAAFFDRILWSISLSWITLACATGRGGFLNTFLSWSPFTVLARLAFGVYLTHLPFIHFYLSTARERMFLSHFNVVSFFFTAIVWCYLLSYLLFICCEAPTGRLDKLVFEPQRKQKEKFAGDVASNANGAEDTLEVITSQQREARI